MKFGNIMCLHAGSRSSGNVFSGRKRLGDEIATVGGGTQESMSLGSGRKADWHGK
jgi:hypothetical protein